MRRSHTARGVPDRSAQRSAQSAGGWWGDGRWPVSGRGSLPADVTQLLIAIEQGDARAAEESLSLVHDVLRKPATRMADALGGRFRRSKPSDR